MKPSRRSILARRNALARSFEREILALMRAVVRELVAKVVDGLDHQEDRREDPAPTRRRRRSRAAPPPLVLVGAPQVPRPAPRAQAEPGPEDELALGAGDYDPELEAWG